MKESSKPKLKIASSKNEPMAVAAIVAATEPQEKKREFDCVIEFKTRLFWQELIPKLLKKRRMGMAVAKFHRTKLAFR